MQSPSPFRPSRGRQSSISCNTPRPVYQDQNTPPRSQLRSRTFSVKLPSLRERSNETSTSEISVLQPLSANINIGNGKKRDTLAGRGAAVVKREVEMNPHFEDLQRRCAERLEQKGGNLTLDAFKSQEKDSSGDHLRQVSSSSSVYGEVGSLSPPHAPGSPPHHGTMNLRDLKKYSRANHDLDNLKSNTSSHGSGGDSVHGAAEDAAEVAQGWQTVLSCRPKNPFTSGTGRDGKPWFTTHEWKTDSLESRPQSIDPRRTYDGTYSPKKNTAQNSTDSSSSTDPTIAVPSAKRKASVFSLRSLQSSIAAKRSRFHFRKMASSVSTHLSEAKRRLKQHNTTNRRNFEA